MENNIPVIKLAGVYLSETWVAEITGISIDEVRRRISSKELKGHIDSNGQASVLCNEVFFTPETMARIMHVKKEDVIDWIKSGELKAIQLTEDYKISYEEYSRFGKSGAWMEKFHNNMFEYMKNIIEDGTMIDEVNEGFRQGMKPHIDKAREVIDYLQEIHVYYEKQLDILNEKSALVASFIITAKLISILHSALNLIEKNELVGASALFRTIYEGIDLVKYFILSEKTKEGERYLKAWFKNKAIYNETCSDFLVKYIKDTGFDKDGKFQKLKDTLYSGYCKFVHLNYDAIMESYNVFTSSGPGGNKIHRMGFDYKSARLLRKSVGFLGCLEELLQGVIIMFLLCFQERLPIENTHITKLQEYNSYYSKNVAERNKELRQNK